MITEAIKEMGAPHWAFVGVLITNFTLILLSVLNNVLTNKARKHSKNADDAVNNSEDCGEPRMFEMVVDIRNRTLTTEEKVENLNSWRESYRGSPWDSGDKVNGWLKANEEQNLEMSNKISNIESNCPIANTKTKI